MIDEFTLSELQQYINEAMAPEPVANAYSRKELAAQLRVSHSRMSRIIRAAIADGKMTKVKVAVKRSDGIYQRYTLYKWIGKHDET